VVASIVSKAAVRDLARGNCDRPLPAGARKRVFVAGDSHAMAYIELLQRLALEAARRSPLWPRRMPAGEPAEVARRRCRLRDFDAAVFADIARRRSRGCRGAGVAAVPRLSDHSCCSTRQAQLAGELTAEAAAGRDAEVAEAIAQWRPLAERGVRIVLEAPKPVLPAPPYRCSDRFNAQRGLPQRPGQHARGDGNAAGTDAGQPAAGG
jgi:hypothetical protein